jgi:hypothetical protein
MMTLSANPIAALASILGIALPPMIVLSLLRFFGGPIAAAAFAKDATLMQPRAL